MLIDGKRSRLVLFGLVDLDDLRSFFPAMLGLATIARSDPERTGIFGDSCSCRVKS